jgi:lysine decarboxylase
VPADAPLLAAWLSYVDNRPAAFTIPGHKGAAGLLWTDLGRVLATDVPLYGGLDTVKLSAGVLAEAEARAAQLWGGDWARFSTGGSTHANQVLALAVTGGRVLVARSAHRSTLSGLVLAGLDPVWLPTTVDDRFGVPAGVSEAELRAGLAAAPDARAVFLVEPSYLGTLSDLPALVAVAHDAGLPVIVDQAWGAHFGFHPGLPRHALAAGADAMVLSAHKTLPAYSQASIVVARTDRLDRDRLERAFEVGNTTSPAGSILASTDGARALLADRGPQLLGPLLETVAVARRALREVDGVVVPGPADFPPGRFDAAKLVVLLAGTGADGIAVEQDLIAAGLPVEMADQDTVVPIVTLADTPLTVGRLVGALVAAIERHRGEARPVAVATQWRPAGVGLGAASEAGAGWVGVGATAMSAATAGRMTPRSAFFAPHETVPAAEAIGRISAELVAPYPPGVPVLVPGEVITAEVVAALHAAHARGTRIAYAADPTLRSFQVVDTR